MIRWAAEEEEEGDDDDDYGGGAGGDDDDGDHVEEEEDKEEEEEGDITKDPDADSDADDRGSIDSNDDAATHARTKLLTADNPGCSLVVRHQIIILICRAESHTVSRQAATDEHPASTPEQLMCPPTASGLLSLPLEARRGYPLRVDYIKARATHVPNTEVVLRWRRVTYSHADVPLDPLGGVKGGGEDAFVWGIIPASCLSPRVSAPRLKREELRREMEVGWGTWANKDMMTFTRLPDGLALTLGLYAHATGEYITNFHGKMRRMIRSSLSTGVPCIPYHPTRHPG
jgi:hypothetical protein